MDDIEVNSIHIDDLKYIFMEVLKTININEVSSIVFFGCEKLDTTTWIYKNESAGTSTLCLDTNRKIDTQETIKAKIANALRVISNNRCNFLKYDESYIKSRSSIGFYKNPLPGRLTWKNNSCYMDSLLYCLMARPSYWFKSRLMMPMEMMKFESPAHKEFMESVRDTYMKLVEDSANFYAKEPQEIFCKISKEPFGHIYESPTIWAVLAESLGLLLRKRTDSYKKDGTVIMGREESLPSLLSTEFLIGKDSDIKQKLDLESIKLPEPDFEGKQVLVVEHNFRDERKDPFLKKNNVVLAKKKYIPVIALYSNTKHYIGAYLNDEDKIMLYDDLQEEDEEIENFNDVSKGYKRVLTFYEHSPKSE